MTEHVVVIPVKAPGIGKTRLVGVAPGQREALARAFAADVVTASLATPGVARVVVTTDDGDVAATMAELGVHVCADPGTGLNAALEIAAQDAAGRWPGLRPVALLADLPALRPDELAAALASAPTAPAYVVDADGTGTTLYTAAYDDFAPLFGVASARAHAAAGVAPLSGALAGLRRDVDDLPSLRAAVALGVGPATTAALAVPAENDSDGPPSQ